MTKPILALVLAGTLAACGLQALGAGVYSADPIPVPPVVPQQGQYSVSIVINQASVNNRMPQIWSKCLGTPTLITADSTVWTIHCHN